MIEDIDQEEFMTVEDVGDKLKVHVQTVRRWLRAGELRGYLLGDRAGYRIRKADLVTFLEARQEGKALAA
jgi:excisionase family DNA binding protein